MVPLGHSRPTAGRGPIARFQIRDMQEGGELCKSRIDGEPSNSNNQRTVVVIDGNGESNSSYQL